MIEGGQNSQVKTGQKGGGALEDDEDSEEIN